MRTIEFSQRYAKHPLNVKNDSVVKLIEVLDSKFEDLSDTFKEYDTKYYREGHYKLSKKGDCLILLFLGEGSLGVYGAMELFTTVRRSTPNKRAYYRGLRGQNMIVKVGEKYVI